MSDNSLNWMQEVGVPVADVKWLSTVSKNSVRPDSIGQRVREIQHDAYKKLVAFSTRNRTTEYPVCCK